MRFWCEQFPTTIVPNSCHQKFLKLFLVILVLIRFFDFFLTQGRPFDRKYSQKTDGLVFPLLKCFRKVQIYAIFQRNKSGARTTYKFVITLRSFLGRHIFKTFLPQKNRNKSLQTLSNYPLIDLYIRLYHLSGARTTI